MWRILQCDTPDDYVLATNETHEVREFIERAFSHVNITIKWLGEKGTVNEVGVDVADENRVLVRIDPKYFRPTEVDLLIGNPAKAQAKLGWKGKFARFRSLTQSLLFLLPKLLLATTLFEALVKEMVEADIQLFTNKNAEHRD